MNRVLPKILYILGRIFNRLRMYVYMPLFGSGGKEFRFDPDGMYSFSNIFVGDSSNLGFRPIIMAGLSRVIIGNHVMFGPEVMIVGGGAQYRRHGKVYG